MDATSQRWHGLGDWLRDALEATGLTQRELADLADVSDRTISALVNGARQQYRPGTLRRIGEALAGDPHILERVLADVSHYPVDEVVAHHSQFRPEEPEPGDDTTAFRHGAGGRDVTELEAYTRAALNEELQERRAVLYSVTVHQFTRRGCRVRTEENDLDLVAEFDGGAVLVEVKTSSPKRQREAVNAGVGNLLLRRGDYPGSSLLLVTDLPIDDELADRVRGQGVAYAWLGDWSALDELVPT